ncbi:amidinotransferase [Lewinellaceae bacterium SD302]|nr:amidinotransferase [Lewinellaceae bacterium SD302]
MISAQTTNQIMMVRPRNFGFNPETAEDNVFQTPVAKKDLKAVAVAGIEEFDAFVEKLRAAGVDVHVIQDSDQPEKRDAIYPNNWITTHADGLIVTYPMLSESRRLERRPEIINYLEENFQVSRRLTLESWEEQDLILEGTGSMILDRENRIVYCSLSQRADEPALRDWAEAMRYEVCAFHSEGESGKPIYHTNVLMALGTTHAVICLDVIPNPLERRAVVEKLESTGKKIVEISNAQVDQFAGNMLEVVGTDGPIWSMSSSAFNALTPDQREELSNGGKTQLLHSDLSTIEQHGGGSARCMMAELFLPENQS